MPSKNYKFLTSKGMYNLGKRFGENADSFFKNPNENMIGLLSYYGDKIVNELAKNKTTQNITGNQFESYGWAVFFKSKKIDSGYSDRYDKLSFDATYMKEHNRGHKSGRRAAAAVNGRSWVSEREGQQQVSGSIYELHIFNAAWYTIVHPSRGFKVLEPSISPSWIELQSLITMNGAIKADLFEFNSKRFSLKMNKKIRYQY